VNKQLVVLRMISAYTGNELQMVVWPAPCGSYCCVSPIRASFIRTQFVRLNAIVAMW